MTQEPTVTVTVETVPPTKDVGLLEIAELRRRLDALPVNPLADTEHGCSLLPEGMVSQGEAAQVAEVLRQRRELDKYNRESWWAYEAAKLHVLGLYYIGEANWEKAAEMFDECRDDLRMAEQQVKLAK